VNNPQNPADPYMTLTGYFNSPSRAWRCRRIAEDEVTSRLKDYGNRLRQGETTGLFAKRDLKEVVELTSRISTAAVSKAKIVWPRLSSPKPIAWISLATNMISVGLDISRLGLMRLGSQTTAEYIQATSGVGREGKLASSLPCSMCISRATARTMSASRHGTRLLRSVEATSVTPFSPRALDRGLAEVTVAMSRQGGPHDKGPQCAARHGNAVKPFARRGYLRSQSRAIRRTGQQRDAATP